MSHDGWVPDGAPYPYHRPRDYTTFELEASARFALGALGEMPVDHKDRKRLEAWFQALADERADRERIAREDCERGREGAAAARDRVSRVPGPAPQR